MFSGWIKACVNFHEMVQVNRILLNRIVILVVSENGVLAPQLIFNVPLYDTVLQKLLAGDLYTVGNIQIPKIPFFSHTSLTKAIIGSTKFTMFPRGP